MEADKLNLKWALETLAAAPDLAAHAVNRAYFDGDHYQNGSGWKGPKPDTTTGGAIIDHEIKRSFVSANATREIVERRTLATIGREPVWKVTLERDLADREQPTPDETALIAEANGHLVRWWDRHRAHLILQDIADTDALAGRAIARLFVPPIFLREGRIPPAPIAEQLRRIHVHHPLPDQARVIVDADSLMPTGVYATKRGDVQHAEIVYLDDRGRTVLRVLEGDASPRESQALALGGRLTIYETTGRALVTPQVRENQDQLNLTLTMQGRNNVFAGFVERLLVDVQMPGEWVKDEATGKEKFKPAAVEMGPTRTNFFNAYAVTDEKGELVYKGSPQVHRFEPVDPEPLVKGEQAFYRNILREARQAFVMISGDATASGESRKQAVQDFVSSLGRLKARLDALGRWLLETVLALSAELAGEAGRYDGLRVAFECKLTAVEPSSEERRVILEMHDARLISRRTAMMLLGIDDPDAEAAAVDAERDTSGALDRLLADAREPPEREREPAGDARMPT